MATNDQLASGINMLANATASGNLAQFQELIRQFNLNYANSVAQLYGQNWGTGQPAPIGAYTMAQQQAYGGYYPANQLPYGTPTQAAQAQTATMAGSAAGLTGYYNNPQTWRYQPGTTVRNLETGEVGVIQPNGQLQVTPTAGQGIPPEQIVPAGGAYFQELLRGQGMNAPTQQAINQQVGLAAGEAGLTGVYNRPGSMMAQDVFGRADVGTQKMYLQYANGDPVLAAQNYLGDVQKEIRSQGGDPNVALGGGPTQTLAANEQYYRQGLDAIKAAAALQANPFRQAQVMGQLGGLLGGQGVAGFQAPGQAQGQTDFSGMGNMQRMIDDIRGGPNAANSQSMGATLQGMGLGGADKSWYGAGATQFGTGETTGASGDFNAQGQWVANPAMAQRPGGIGQYAQGILNAIPTPTKLDSVSFLRASPGTQNIVLTGMQEKYGLDPTESLAQIKNTLPQFQSPTTFGGIKR